jgi:hypothetical protein
MSAFETSADPELPHATSTPAQTSANWLPSFALFDIAAQLTPSGESTP